MLAHLGWKCVSRAYDFVRHLCIRIDKTLSRQVLGAHSSCLTMNEEEQGEVFLRFNIVAVETSLPCLSFPLIFPLIYYNFFFSPLLLYLAHFISRDCLFFFFFYFFFFFFFFLLFFFYLSFFLLFFRGFSSCLLSQ